MGHYFSPLVPAKPEEKPTLLENAFFVVGFREQFSGPKVLGRRQKLSRSRFFSPGRHFFTIFQKTGGTTIRLHLRSKNIFTRHRSCDEHFLGSDNSTILTEIIAIGFTLADPQNFNAVSRDRRFVTGKIQKFRQYT